jgi:hypothetical protein
MVRCSLPNLRESDALTLCRIDRDYDPVLFEDAFPINYSACLSLAYYTCSSTIIFQATDSYSEQANVETWQQGVIAES